MTSGYRYQVPTYASSPWDTGVVPVPETPWMYQAPGTIRQVDDPNRPRVGIYCPHGDERPWLIGSFTVSAFLWWDLDPAKWAWQRMWNWHLEWLTGDGVLFPLFGVPQRNLIDNRVVEPESGALQRTTTEDGRIVLQHEKEEPRGYVAMTCRVCGQQGSQRRLEKIQHSVAALWSNGLREVPLTTFERFLD